MCFAVFPYLMSFSEPGRLPEAADWNLMNIPHLFTLVYYFSQATHHLNCHRFYSSPLYTSISLYPCVHLAGDLGSIHPPALPNCLSCSSLHWSLLVLVKPAQPLLLNTRLFMHCWADQLMHHLHNCALSLACIDFCHDLWGCNDIEIQTKMQGKHLPNNTITAYSILPK